MNYFCFHLCNFMFLKTLYNSHIARCVFQNRIWVEIRVRDIYYGVLWGLKLLRKERTQNWSEEESNLWFSFKENLNQHADVLKGNNLFAKENCSGLFSASNNMIFNVTNYAFFISRMVTLLNHMRIIFRSIQTSG